MIKWMREGAATKAAQYRAMARYWVIEQEAMIKDSGPWARYRFNAALCHFLAALWEVLA